MYCSIKLFSYIRVRRGGYFFFTRRVLHLAELLELAAALLLAVFAIDALAQQKNEFVVFLAQPLHLLLHLLHLLPLTLATIASDLAVSLQTEFLAVFLGQRHV